jgi:hypothetical protein
MFLDQSRWWRTALSSRPDDPFSHERDRLRAALDGFRRRAALLAATIAQDLPDFTVHDQSHLDALWEVGETAAGPGLELTPTEAFVFGGAVLLHDLGLAVAAYPDLADLRVEPVWSDALAIELRRELGRWPSKDEIANGGRDAIVAATRSVLRLRHADRAASLADVNWPGPGNTPLFLLDDSGLRAEFGWLIGRIAASHWWPARSLRDEFGVLHPAPSSFPADWTLRPLLLACILRVADAAHIDSRRAPEFVRATRNLSELSSLHWSAQERLSRPLLVGDRLQYQATKPFGIDDAESWWVAVELLRQVDSELRSVDDLLADLRVERLAAKAVAGVDSLGGLSTALPTVGWSAVDAAVHVSDVARLVNQLGGAALYGDRPWVPLRELIQNSSDAVRLRRILEGRPEEWACVWVGLVQRADGVCIEVEDNGVGMSKELMVGPLLDFGTSLWSSPDLVRFHPGAASSGFAPTGRFGIGFFSVFMWGDAVTVTSRALGASVSETLTLEFRRGIGGRPIVRPAGPEESLRDGGTRVSVLLREPEAVLGTNNQMRALIEMIMRLCPASEIAVFARENGDERLVVGANDWVDLDAHLLCDRLGVASGSDLSSFEDRLSNSRRIAQTLEPIYGLEGGLRGRLTFVDETLRTTGRELGVVHAGGFRVQGTSFLAGVVEGVVASASRTEARDVGTGLDLPEWASRQAAAHRKRRGRNGVINESEIAAMCLTCGAHSGPLALAAAGENVQFLDPPALQDWILARSYIRLVDATALGGVDIFVALADDVLVYTEHADAVAEVRRFFSLPTEAASSAVIGPVVDQVIVNAWRPSQLEWKRSGELDRSARRAVGLRRVVTEEVLPFARRDDSPPETEDVFSNDIVTYRRSRDRRSRNNGL